MEKIEFGKNKMDFIGPLDPHVCLKLSVTCKVFEFIHEYKVKAVMGALDQYH